MNRNLRIAVSRRFVVTFPLTCLCTLGLLAQAQPQSAGQPASLERYRYHQPAQMNDGWKTATLEAAGMDRAPIEALTNAIRRYPEWNIHAVLIERDGKLVYERYFSGEDQRWGRPLGHVTFDPQTKHDLRSVTKSVVSGLVGIALGVGKIKSVDQSLTDFFPEHSKNAGGRPRMNLRHVLTMTAGMQWDEDIPYTDPRNDEIAMTRSRDPIGYIFSKPQVTPPGSEWNYNGGLPQMLAVIVERVSGQSLRDFARVNLFEPLGITDVEWLGDLAGTPSGASGLRMRPRDLAKFGSLYLHGGRWNGRQIIPESWIRESTRPSIALAPPANAFGKRSYGYQWWLMCYQTPWGPMEASIAVGNGQQRIYVLPDVGIVLTVTAGRYNDFTASTLTDRMLMEHILPSLRLPADWTSKNTSCRVPQMQPDEAK